MNQLEAYFADDFKKDWIELTEVQSLCSGALKTILDNYDEQEKGWPYSLGDSEEDKGTESISTQSMILSTILHASGLIKDSDFHYNKRNIITSIYTDKKSKYHEDNFDKRICAIIKSFYKRINIKNRTHFESKTYGKDDPFSLNWIQLILNNTKKSSSLRNVYSIIEKRSIDLQSKIPTPDKIIDQEFAIQNDSVFIAMKSLHVVKATNKNIKVDTFKKYFETKLHLNLSYFNIPDARFDPAEVAFALEGALLCTENCVSDETIERAFSILEESQKTTKQWRPVNPVYATKGGLTFLPLSIEVANSILRSCMLLNSAKKGESYFSKHAQMFKSYFKWLKAQALQIQKDNTTYVGWGSEHVGAPDTIHLWQTSEIANFLINYAVLLEQRIADKSLAASGLKSTRCNDPKLASTASDKDRLRFWDSNIIAKFEPLQSFDSKYQIYAKLRNTFIAPRLSSQKDSQGIKPEHSLLLYGPPGTGKTSLAKNIATTLGWNLITVTPSDFLAGGSSEVESRAKSIFKCLEFQKKSVILFDEIDQFLLDRASKAYRTQTGIFQFMTPGMLPKFNDLRAKANNIFIIATNYEERIDPAIKRKGRIDIRYPLLPPDEKTRQQIIMDFINTSNVKKAIGELKTTHKQRIENFTKQLSVSTALCTYGDLKSAKYEIEQKAIQVATESIEANSAAMEIDCLPSISIAQYNSRIKEQQKPWHEMLFVAHLGNTELTEAMIKSLQNIDTASMSKAIPKEIQQKYPQLFPNNSPQ